MPGFQPRLAPTMWSVARRGERVEAAKKSKREKKRWVELDMVGGFSLLIEMRVRASCFLLTVYLIES
jgi:hypothetical protein